MERFRPPPPEIVAELRADADRRLSAEEFNAWVHAPMTEAEAQAIDELIDWYTRRYPTPAARLAQARRAWRRWAAGMPPSR